MVGCRRGNKLEGEGCEVDSARREQQKSPQVLDFFFLDDAAVFRQNQTLVGGVISVIALHDLQSAVNLFTRHNNACDSALVRSCWSTLQCMTGNSYSKLADLINDVVYEDIECGWGGM